MSVATHVTYRDLDASNALNSIISKRLQKLERFSSDINHSRVVLDSPHKHKHKGKQFRATVELDLKGSPITISQDDPSIHIAVRNAFNAAERKLKAYSKQCLSSRHKTDKRAVEQPMTETEEELD